MKLYIVDNYGRIKAGQDTNIAYTIDRNAAINAVKADWEHLTEKEQKRIGNKYAVSVYEVPEELHNLNPKNIASEMIDMGLMESDSDRCDAFVIDASNI